MNREDFTKISTPGDSRLTAYALDELSEIDRAELGRELDRSQELRAEIEAIRTIAAQLRVEFARAATDTAQASLNDSPTRSRQRSQLRWAHSNPFVAISIGAVLLAIFGQDIWHSATEAKRSRSRRRDVEVAAGDLSFTGRNLPPSLVYDISNVQSHAVLASESLRLSYDNPVQMAQLDGSFLSFTVSY